MTPADKLQKTCGCWSKSAGNWAKRILVYGFSKVSTWEYTGSSCNFNSRHCHLQSDMILVHANKNEFVKSLDILRSLKKKGGGDYHLWCPVAYLFFPFMLFCCYSTTRSLKTLSLSQTYFNCCSKSEKSIHWTDLLSLSHAIFCCSCVFNALPVIHI